MNFKEELQIRTQAAEEVVCKYLPAETGYQKTIFEAMNYSVMAGGKRLRPLMMKEVFRLFGGSDETIEPFMAAMEMIHSSSLVHDDLPCMDNDLLRRGKPTTWSKYGEGMGVLAGDALMIYAFETASKALAMDSVDPSRVARSIQVLAEETGIYGMIGGQTVDVELTGKPVDEDRLEFIYRLKTGALLRGSFVIGAVMAGADEAAQKICEEIADSIGMAFQIKDDLLDLTSTAEQLGKPIGSDLRNEKTTYVTIYGMEQAEQLVVDYSDKALSNLAALKEQYHLTEDGFLTELIKMLVVREK